MKIEIITTIILLIGLIISFFGGKIDVIFLQSCSTLAILMIIWTRYYQDKKQLNKVRR